MKMQPPALRIWEEPWTGSDGKPPRSAANHKSPARAQSERGPVKWDREREMLLTRADLSAFEEIETTSDFLMLDFKCGEMWREISILQKQLYILMENYMQYIYMCVLLNYLHFKDVGLIIPKAHIIECYMRQHHFCSYSY